jgi:hypothetical protein
MILWMLTMRVWTMVCLRRVITKMRMIRKRLRLSRSVY